MELGDFIKRLFYDGEKKIIDEMKEFVEKCMRHWNNYSDYIEPVNYPVSNFQKKSNADLKSVRKYYKFDDKVEEYLNDGGVFAKDYGQLRERAAKSGEKRKDPPGGGDGQEGSSEKKKRAKLDGKKERNLNNICYVDNDEQFLNYAAKLARKDLEGKTTKIGKTKLILAASWRAYAQASINHAVAALAQAKDIETGNAKATSMDDSMKTFHKTIETEGFFENKDEGEGEGEKARLGDILSNMAIDAINEFAAEKESDSDASEGEKEESGQPVLKKLAKGRDAVHWESNLQKSVKKLRTSTNKFKGFTFESKAKKGSKNTIERMELLEGGWLKPPAKKAGAKNAKTQEQEKNEEEESDSNDEKSSSSGDQQEEKQQPDKDEEEATEAGDDHQKTDDV